MSESPSPSSALPASDQSTAKESKFRKWRRRIRRTLVVIIVLVIVARMALYYAVRPALQRVANAYNVNITFDRQEMTLAAADVGFSNIKITPKSGGAPLLQTDYIRGHISLPQLLKGRLYVYRAEADGVDLTLERDKDGHIVLLDQLARANQTPTPPPTTAPQRQLDFTSPLKVEAFRLQHVRVKLRDASVNPPLEALLAMDLRVSNLGAFDRPVLFEANIWSDPALDVCRVIGQGKSHGRDIDATIGVFVRGLHLKPLSGYLASAGIHPYENDLGLKMSATLKTQPAEGNPNGVTATLAVDRFDVTSQGRSVASVQAMQIDADDIDATSAKIASLVVNGVRAAASRDERGVVRFAGLEFTGGGTNSPAPAETKASPFPVSLRNITVRDVQADFHDAAVTPPTDLKFVLTQFASTGASIDPSNPQSVMPIDATMSLPGLVQTITLKGQCKPCAPEKTVDVAFHADGIRPDLAKPYLARAGIESILNSAQAEGTFAAKIRRGSVDAQLSNLRLSDAAELIAMPQVRVSALGTEPTSGRLRIEEIQLTGPSLDVTRDPAGRITVAGFRYTPNSEATTPAAPVAEGPTTKPSPATILPRIEIDRLAWRGLHLHLHDQTRQPPAMIAFDATVDGRDLVVDLQSDTPPTKPGQLRVHLSAPEIVKTFDIDATLQPARNKLAAQFTLRGKGLNGKLIAPYLAPLGIEPVIQNGAMQVAGDVNLASQPDRLAGSFSLHDTKITDGGQELGGIDQLHVGTVSLMNSGDIDVKSVQLTHPRINVARDVDGALVALGVRLPPPAQSASPAHAPPPAPVQKSSHAVFSLADLRIEDAQLGWADRMTKTPADIHARANLQASKIVLGKKAEPLSFRASISIEDLVQQASATGRFDASPGAMALVAALDASGVHGNAIAPYLPPGIELATTDGRFKATVEANLAQNPQRGNRGKLIVQNLDWRDGTQPPLLAFDAFRFSASRIDPAANVIALDELSLAGLITGAQQQTDGSVRALGLAIRPVKPVHANEARPKADAQLAAQKQERPRDQDQSTDVSALLAEAKHPLPLVTLQKLDLGIRSAKVQNLATPEAAPVELQEVSLRNVAPIALGGPDAKNQPPVKLALAGKVSPVIDQLQVMAEATPLANSPTLSVELSAAGIRGKGITDLVPSLRQQMNGDALIDGRLGAKFQTQIKYDRRGPRDFDLSRGFQADVLLEQMQFREGEHGPVLAGLDAIRAEQVRVEPKNGNVFAKLIELEKPQFRASREADGIHALGIVIPSKQSTTAPAAPAESAPREPSPSMGDPARAPEAQSEKPGGEIRIDRIMLSGLDVRVEDHLVNPPTLIPLNGMDLEVRDFTTRALVEPRVIRYAFVINADKVPLRPGAKAQSGSGIIGAIGSVASRAAGEQKSTVPTMEERDLFSQVSSTGRLALYPHPNGYVKGSFSGVELGGFEGEVRQAGVELTGGIYDGTFDVRFQDNGDLEARTKSVVSDLQLKEPSNGPIAKHLRLTAPVDAVVKTVEDPSGSITIPLNVNLKQGNVSGGEITGAAVAALSSVLATAVASAPVKVVAGAGNIIGLGNVLGTKNKNKVHEPVELAFAPGSTQLDPATRAQLAKLLDAMERTPKLQLTVRNDLGADDVSVASVRANPSPEDCRALVAQLMAKKSAANQRRAQLASQLEAHLASSAADSTDSIEQLRDTDRQIAEMESSIDQLLDLLRPGADRQALRRTRAACLQILQARTDAVKQLLNDPNIRGASDRIHYVSDRPADRPANAQGRVMIIAKE